MLARDGRWGVYGRPFPSSADVLSLRLASGFASSTVLQRGSAPARVHNFFGSCCFFGASVPAEAMACKSYELRGGTVPRLAVPSLSSECDGSIGTIRLAHSLRGADKPGYAFFGSGSLRRTTLRLWRYADLASAPISFRVDNRTVLAVFHFGGFPRFGFSLRYLYRSDCLFGSASAASTLRLETSSICFGFRSEPTG